VLRHLPEEFWCYYSIEDSLNEKLAAEKLIAAYSIGLNLLCISYILER
jgi:hypothetical protein